jgi:hypothetical protein
MINCVVLGNTVNEEEASDDFGSLSAKSDSSISGLADDEDLNAPS